VRFNQSGNQRQWLDEAELKFLILSLQRQLKALWQRANADKLLACHEVKMGYRFVTSNAGFF